MSHSEEAVKKQVRVYRNILLALAVLTGVTVGVARLHLPLFYAVAVALAIACLKGSLVAGYFMHLTTEKRIILSVLTLTVFFFFVLLFSSVLHHF